MINDLQVILKPMKNEEDGLMPSKKLPLLTLYLRLVAENSVRVTFDEGYDGLIVGEGSLVEVIDEAADNDNRGNVYQMQAI